MSDIIYTTSSFLKESQDKNVWLDRKFYSHSIDEHRTVSFPTWALHLHRNKFTVLMMGHYGSNPMCSIQAQDCQSMAGNWWEPVGSMETGVNSIVGFCYGPSLFASAVHLSSGGARVEDCLPEKATWQPCTQLSILLVQVMQSLEFDQADMRGTQDLPFSRLPWYAACVFDEGR